MLSRRLMLAAGGAAPLAIATAARAQSPAPDQLQRLIERALQAQETVRFARPEPLGFVNVAVVTRQLGLHSGNMEYYLAVTDPRLPDGLIFFSNEPANRTYRMHRTDTHLRRVASASNDLKLGNQGLTAWDGPSADNDFTAQLAFWATVK
ncbi:MAG: hypothetical protein JO055_13425 [Alphaproteobacteria bacterium]|nr:hypothetical protein [Alphaproteobacteria bacterium]